MFLHNDFKSKQFLKENIGINFYCRVPFQLDDYPSDKCDVKRAADYDVPCASGINDD